MKALKAAIATLVVIMPMTSFAAQNYLMGNVSNITSNGNGLLIQLDSGLPDNCVGTPYNWMLVKEANKTMVSVVLAMWASGKLKATVFTNQYSGTGFCEINQIDPQPL